MSDKKQPGPGTGPTNLSGVRGTSPVLRVRVPAELLEAVEEKAARNGENVPDVVRELLRRWSHRK